VDVHRAQRDTLRTVLVRAPDEAFGRAFDEPVAIGYAAVRDSQGRTWEASNRFEQPLVRQFGGHQLQPGIPVEAEIAFEVPPQAATDLTLRLSQRPNLYTGLGMQQAVMEVPAPLDEATLVAGQDETQVRLVGPEVVGGGPP
jgi:hypothetical protein